MATFALFTCELTIERKLVAPELISEYKHIEEALLITIALSLVTVLPQFWSLKVLSTPMRFYLSVTPVFVSWVRRARSRLPG